MNEGRGLGEVWKSRINYLSIFGGILAFISLILPWWTLHLAGSSRGTTVSVDFSVYPYRTTAPTTQVSLGTYSQAISMNLWFGQVTIVLVVIGGVLGLVGSVGTLRMLLGLGGLSIVSSIVVFAVGLQDQLSKGALPTGWPTGPTGLSLFSFGAYSFSNLYAGYWAYLSFGFWLALVAGTLMFAALKRRPLRTIPS